MCSSQTGPDRCVRVLEFAGTSDGGASLGFSTDKLGNRATLQSARPPWAPAPPVAPSLEAPAVPLAPTLPVIVDMPEVIAIVAVLSLDSRRCVRQRGRVWLHFEPRDDWIG
jgi:hypothetical protein